jgi:choline dehydrogenase
MGDKNDEMAVVDSDCRLIGLNGIRVVDSSIFPEITNGNLNAPTIMVAEKVADKILKKSIKPMKIDTWVDPYWKTKQRFSNSILYSKKKCSAALRQFMNITLMFVNAQ